MATYAWATPRKVDEYYLQPARVEPRELWRAVASGIVSARIKGVVFPNPYIAAILELLNENTPEPERSYILPIWIEVRVDDVERVLCAADLPVVRSGRPKKMGAAVRRDYDLAVKVSRLIQDGTADTVAAAARFLIEQGDVEGASIESRMKRVQRAYSQWFRTD